MKAIKYSPKFTQHYKERISKDERLVREFLEAVDLFLANRQDSGDHSLGGKMQNKKAFRINKDYRVVYIEREDDFLFLDIGTHEQIYCR